MTTWLDVIADRIEPLDAAAVVAARSRLDSLTKPPGSLGRLEALAAQLAGITGNPLPTVERPAIVVFAGDHGVTVRGVSAYAREVTAQMVTNFVRGGAAINVLARSARASLTVVDVGVAGPVSYRADEAGVTGARLVTARVAAGTRDMTVGPAMSRHEALAAIAAGRSIVRDEIASGSELIAVGEMGIGNTTAASALVAALTGERAAVVTGRGTGLDDTRLDRKVKLIDRALVRHAASAGDPLAILASLGGLEIAGVVGAILASAEARIPVVLDGFITGAAALVAAAIAPSCVPRLIASHRSTEPGHRIVLERLGAVPLLDLELRLGEGTGAALALPIIHAATAILREMATFEVAGVSTRRGG